MPPRRVCEKAHFECAKRALLIREKASAERAIFSNRREEARRGVARARRGRFERASRRTRGCRRRARAETLDGTRTDGKDVVVVLHLRAGLDGHAAHVAGSRRVPSVLGGEAADVRAGARGEHGEGSSAVASSDREAHRSGRTRDESDVCASAGDTNGPSVGFSERKKRVFSQVTSIHGNVCVDIRQFGVGLQFNKNVN